VNSDTRNTFAKEGHGFKRSYLKIDPNYATPQQLAATLLISGERHQYCGPIARVKQLGVEYRQRIFFRRAAPVRHRLHRRHVRQGVQLQHRQSRRASNYGARFPADPVLQTMRLALDIVAARDRSAARHKLVTENFIRTPDTYGHLHRRSPFPTSTIRPNRPMSGSASSKATYCPWATSRNTCRTHSASPPLTNGSSPRTSGGRMLQTTTTTPAGGRPRPRVPVCRRVQRRHQDQ
jgi:hypothetical protein